MRTVGPSRKWNWSISEMELEYLGVTSIWEDRCRGEYGDIPTYHAISSPQGANEDGYSMLEGSTAEVLLEMEATLLRIDDAGKDDPPDRRWHWKSTP